MKIIIREMKLMRRGNFRGRGRNQGNWPGNGPFSHLPPWERPGWIYGRGSCWYGTYSGVGFGTAAINLPKVGHSLDDDLNSPVRPYIL